MKLFQRYILKELLAPFCLGLVAFTFIILVNKIIRLTELIINKGVGFLNAVLLFSYILPAFLVLAIPCTVLISSQVAFGRLSSDNETTALLAGGQSFYRFLPPVFLLSAGAFAMSLFLMVFAVPRANRSFSNTLHQIGSQIIQAGSPFDIRERVFWDGLNDMVVYVNEIPPGKNVLKGVLIGNYRQTKEPQVITASSGQIVSRPDSLKITIRLHNGSIHTFINQARYRKIDFASYELQLNLADFLPRKEEDKREREMSIAELREKIAESKAGKDGEAARYEVELHKKFSLPFVCLLLGFIGAPLGMGDSRTMDKTAAYVVSVVIVLVYYIVLRTGESLGEVGKLPPLLAVWLPNLLLLPLAVRLVSNTARQRPIKAVLILSAFSESLRSKTKKLLRRIDM